MSIAKSRRRNCLRRLSVSINLSCHSEEHPQGYLLRGAKRRGNPKSFSCKFAEKRKICAILEQFATPVCGLARNDRLFRQPEKNRPPAVLFSLSINPLYGVSGSFTQGELEGAKPAPRIRSNVAQSLALQGVRGAKRLFSCRKAAQK